ncbi:MAG: U32 family peptidase [Alphaproteobacteria bacterium]|nr:U32 family peptidase [Alphaproteobacteria bacterium]
MSDSLKLTLGPLLFNWPADQVAEFYGRIAELAPVDTVCLGEVVCQKREPLLGGTLAEAAGQLADAGKEVVWSGYGLIADEKDMAATKGLAESSEGLVEANDITALPFLQGRPHAIGPLVNVYNEDTLRWLVARGATRICLAPELSRDAIARLTEAAGEAELEVQVFGRLPLALSARCYHARAHGLHKDGCQYVCDRDPDGMAVDTLDNEHFLAVNGIQTLSHSIVELSAEIDDLIGIGVTRFRLSPHHVDMVAIAHVWRDLLEGKRDLPRARRIIQTVAAFAPPSNGYFHARPGAVALNN